MGRAGGGSGDGGEEPAALEAVRSFERWKKKYSRRTRRLRLQRKERERPEWQVEREGIGRLVQRYPQVRRGRERGLGGGREGGSSAPVGREWELSAAAGGNRLVCGGGREGFTSVRQLRASPRAELQRRGFATLAGWGSRVLRVGEEERAEAEAEAGGVAVAASPVSR